MTTRFIMKPTTYRNPKLLKLAEGQSCVSCGTCDGTVVSAHSNQGKGMGIKASDATIMHLCHQCHTEYDQGHQRHRYEKREFAEKMNGRTLRRLLEQGHLVVSMKPVDSDGLVL